MDLAISALILAVIGLSLALFAIMTALQVALRAKKKASLSNGLYRMRKIGEDGLDTLFELEEISKEVNDEPKEGSKVGRRTNQKAKS